MDIESVRGYCLSLPHTTEKVQWGNDLLFRIGEKMYAVLCLDASSQHLLSFKCTPEKYEELIERESIVPAPYMARNKWVALQSFDALPKAELESLLKTSYDLVLSKLPKRVQTELGAPAPPPPPAKRKKA